MEVTQKEEEAPEFAMEESKGTPMGGILVDNIATTSNKPSYKDRLMSDGLDKLNPYEIIDMQALIIKPLEKNLNLQTMERWINRRWTKKEAVRVIDLVGGYFIVRFSSQEDYSHALFEGP
ncbi:hypothetical protein Ahy_A10g048701 [Arachis hypogaea]|uniref:DUF4283 domain-containing protein n=1 Tax=Arachis hypogaea TaxID=3818 RepID=A0A445B5P0_ARAHY|nr:hypothetical protein Ahy_A10g048701 [Arachis hypogaea]